jgi:hypothetical protein
VEGFKGELPREAIRLSLDTRQIISRGAGMGIGLYNIPGRQRMLLRYCPSISLAVHSRAPRKPIASNAVMSVLPPPLADQTYLGYCPACCRQRRLP